MNNLLVAPGFDLDLDTLFPTDALNLDSVLSGLLSQTGGFNNLGLGEVVSTFKELVTEAAGNTIRYVGEFVSTVDQNLLGSTSGLTGTVQQIIVEHAGDVVAVLNLDDALGLDFGELTSLNLLGIDLGDITGGLLGDLLGTVLGTVGSVLDVVDGPVDTVLDTVQGLLDDLASNGDTGGTPTEGNDILLGSDNADTINALGGDDLVYGRGGNDILHGNAGVDTIYGGAGNDRLYGDAGADVLIGGNGKDRLNGGADNDTLIGSRGRDLLTGGSGADDFVFLSAKDSRAHGGIDTIRDFNKAQGDEIDLSGFGDFDFIGRHRFTGHGDELRVVRSHGDTLVQGDLNGDHKVDFTIRIDGKVHLTDGDFIL